MKDLRLSIFTLSIFLMTSSWAESGPLKLKEVLKSTRNHFPLIQESIQEFEAAKQKAAETAEAAALAIAEAVKHILDDGRLLVETRTVAHQHLFLAQIPLQVDVRAGHW